MENRGDTSEQLQSHSTIFRRSCDQCRARKIACDRASPCSGCTNARLSCTHSTIATRTRESKQRIFVSHQYEQKVDNISESVDEIRRLLQRLEVSSELKIPERGFNAIRPISREIIGSAGQQPCPFEGESSLGAQSLDASRFVEAIPVPNTAHVGKETLLTSLREVLRRKNDQVAVYQMSFPEDESPSTVEIDKPNALAPLEAVTFILRWAQEHSSYYVAIWLSQILPLQRFINICQKVYFAVNGYSEAEFILANGCLHWIFSEYAIISGQLTFRDYSMQCRRNIESAFKRLPFLLPASIEIIAALTVGALHAIEVSKAVLAWTFVSSASHLCQTMGYHQSCFLENDNEHVRAAKQRLFMTIYRIDKSLSLRLGRASNIQEYTLSLPPESTEHRWNETATILGRVYEQLYSPSGLSHSLTRRIEDAEALAGEMQSLIDESRNPNKSFTTGSGDITGDTLRCFHLEAEQVTRFSALSLIYRVIRADSGAKYSFSERCIISSREALAAHQRSLGALQACTSDPLELRKYINCIILHTPFIPFIILFRTAIEAFDTSDLSRLASFVASMQSIASTSTTYRLFEILYQVAQLHIEANANFETLDQDSLNDEFNDYLSILDFTMPLGTYDGTGNTQEAGRHDRGGDSSRYNYDLDGFISGVGRASSYTSAYK